MPRTLVTSAVLLTALVVGGCGTSTAADQAVATEAASDGKASTAADTDGTVSNGVIPAPSPDPGADRAEPPTDLPVPDVLKFESRTVAGDAFDGASLAGRPTVLWFWSPWCPTCRAQISGVSALADRHGDRVHVVGVGGLDDEQAIAAFAADVDPAVILLSDEEGAVWRHFGVTAQSTYVVLDEYGSALESGYLDDDELAGVVDGLVG